MSLISRFRSLGPAVASRAVTAADTPERDASRLIDEGNASEDGGRLDEALQCYEAAIRLTPRLARAHLNRGIVLLATDHIEEALASFATATSLEPESVPAHFNMGIAYARAGRHGDARAAFESALSLKPDFADAQVALGCSLEELGDLDTAAACYRHALSINPDYAEVHCNLGNALLELGQPEEALASYRHAIGINPNLATAWANLGNAFWKRGQNDDAVASLRKALDLDPNCAQAHCSLGNVLKSVGLFHDAVASYHRALEIKPDFAEAHSNLGCALSELRQFDDAAASCWRALAIDPNYVAAYNNLGSALAGLGRVKEAESVYRRALEINPDFEILHFNLGNVLRHSGCPGEAVASYRRALELRPDYVDAHINLGDALQELGQLEAAAECYRQSLRLEPDYAGAQSRLLFCLSHQEAIGAQALFAEHCRFGEKFESPLRASWPQHGNAGDPTRCLQIGFVSADLRDHVVARFIEPLLMHLAGSAALSLHAYYSHANEDSISARLHNFFKHWHSSAHLSDAALAQKIADDRIDILVDLSGHTGENRLLTFARKPAPVQVSWIGYPGTTGLKAMDYYLADRHFLPPDEFQSQFIEKLVYLPVNAPFLPGAEAPVANALPALRNRHMTFGTFNRIGKLSRSAIALWARLMRALPDSIMLLGGMPPVDDYVWLMDWFAQEGIARERLRPYSRCDRDAYLALHLQVDICLDTFPYTGGTTSCLALWMGVPTLTLAGHTPAGRQGAAVMGSVGLDGFIAADAADFERKGLSWAADPAALADVRAGLRARVERSLSRRPEEIAGALEGALRTMWRRWCAGLPPESFEAGTQGAIGASMGDVPDNSSGRSNNKSPPAVVCA